MPATTLFSNLGVSIKDTRRTGVDHWDKGCWLTYTTATQVTDSGVWNYFTIDESTITPTTTDFAWERKVLIKSMACYVSTAAGDATTMGVRYLDLRLYDRDVDGSTVTDTRDKRVVEYLGVSGDDYDEFATEADFEVLWKNYNREKKITFAVRVMPAAATPANVGYFTIILSGLALV
ncbi:MAG: hypothetical protein AAB864_01705 [Patescibacteria group bacterium]